MLRPRDQSGVTPDMRDPATPSDVTISSSAPAPFDDPTMGVAVAARTRSREPPLNRLVTIGDSLTMGFQNNAVFRTEMSYPAMIAHELGAEFRHPVYDGPGDGLPLNFEALVRDLESRFGDRIDVWEAPRALARARKWLAIHEDYWERGPGARFTPPAAINHNLGVSGWSFATALATTARSVEARIRRPRDGLFDDLLPENAQERMELRVLASAGGMDRTVFEAAEALGAQVGGGHDPDVGIDTLVVMLGANSALGTVVRLQVNWQGGPQFDGKRPATVVAPRLFRADLRRAVAAVRRIAARRVIWATVPHVTIAPIARGVEGRLSETSRYFDAYTYPWIAEHGLNRAWDPYLTHQEARAVDSAIDHYNDDIAQAVVDARRDGLDWRILDLAGLLDRLAHRRYIEQKRAQPEWWTPYPLPPELEALEPTPDSRFLSTDAAGRRDAGGLFSLDGVHPTTIGYGVLAQEVVDVMSGAGVDFPGPDGSPRPRPVRIDVRRVMAADTLLRRPPRSVDASVRTIGWIHRNLPFVGALLG
jgi:hypothetical protein